MINRSAVKLAVAITTACTSRQSVNKRSDDGESLTGVEFEVSVKFVDVVLLRSKKSVVCIDDDDELRWNEALQAVMRRMCKNATKRVQKVRKVEQK